MSAFVLLAGFAIALILSVGITPFVLKMANAYHLFDEPDRIDFPDVGRRIHLQPIPRLGGVAIVIAFFVSYWFSASQVQIPKILLFASIAIFLMGAIDDIKPLPAGWRFFFQIFIAFITVHYGNLNVSHVELLPHIELNLPPWLGNLASVFIIVGAINAINMIDGLDGLAGGVSIISLSMLALLYYLSTGDPSIIANLTIPAIGAILGFLRYNTHPATIFMGDNGSNWLGFMIGLHIIFLFNLTTMNALQVPLAATNIPPLVSIIMCCAVPIIDTATVILKRILSKQHPMRGDQSHFHHSLLKLGLNQTQSVTLIYFVSLAAGVLAIMPVAFPRYNLTLTPYIGLAGVILVISGGSKFQTFLNLRIGSQRKLNAVKPKSASQPQLARRLVKHWERMNKYCLFLILAVTPILVGTIPPVLGYASIPLAVLTASFLIFHTTKNDFLESIVITLSCILILVANNQREIVIEILGQEISMQRAYNSLFYFLFLSSFGFLLATLKRRHLELTASDFLLLFLPIVLILCPAELKSAYNLDIISIRSLIVFMAYRTLEKRRQNARRYIKMTTLMALLYVFMVGSLQMRVVYH